MAEDKQMGDIVPELYGKIQNQFESLISKDRKIQGILTGKDVHSEFSDVSLLARKIGEYAAESLTAYLTEEQLPDGRLYWNIMQRTIVPIMRRGYDIVMQMIFIVQEREDSKKGIGIKPIKPDFPLERIEAVMNKLDNIAVGDQDERV